MKKAEDFSNIKYQGLTKTEDMLINKIIDKILANHADDEWWKIEVAIKGAVDRKLGFALSNASFSEKLEREQAREAAEKERREKEAADKESDKILADMLEKNAERMHELKDKIR